MLGGAWCSWTSPPGSEERESQRERERSSCCARAAGSCPGSGRIGVFGVRGDLADVVESALRAANATRAHEVSGERL